MDELEKAIEQAREAVAVAAREVAAVQEKAQTVLAGTVPERALHHAAEAALSLSEADGGLVELRECLSGMPPLAEARS